MLEITIRRGEKCLIISLLADQHYNKEALKKTMRKIWRPVKMFSFKDLGPKLILVEFEACWEKDRVHLEGP